jgi:hypothetical protein
MLVFNGGPERGFHQGLKAHPVLTERGNVAALFESLVAGDKSSLEVVRSLAQLRQEILQDLIHGRRAIGDLAAFHQGTELVRSRLLLKGLEADQVVSSDTLDKIAQYLYGYSSKIRYPLSRDEAEMVLTDLFRLHHPQAEVSWKNFHQDLLKHLPSEKHALFIEALDTQNRFLQKGFNLDSEWLRAQGGVYHLSWERLMYGPVADDMAALSYALGMDGSGAQILHALFAKEPQEGVQKVAFERIKALQDKHLRVVARAEKEGKTPPEASSVEEVFQGLQVRRAEAFEDGHFKALVGETQSEKLVRAIERLKHAAEAQPAVPKPPTSPTAGPEAAAQGQTE